MSRVAELFGYSTESEEKDWRTIVKKQQCPFLGKKCYNVRQSDPNTAIGSCTVLYGKRSEPIIICPSRLIDRQQIFTDGLHLLTTHEPGNQFHIVAEVSIPGGSVDYFLVSANFLFPLLFSSIITSLISSSVVFFFLSSADGLLLNRREVSPARNDATRSRGCGASKICYNNSPSLLIE